MELFTKSKRMMYIIICLFNLLVFSKILAATQINLYYTDQNDGISGVQYSCLRVPTSQDETSISRQVLSYCLSEMPSTIRNQSYNPFPKFTFSELSQLNVTSQHLYIWSAPIDLIERYQLYLEQLSTSSAISMANEVFYNCTLPRFGPMCQFELDYYDENYSSLYAIIDDYYDIFKYSPTNFTCYVHLQCNRGPSPACLDWSEVCNGQVDCLNGDWDEQDCWQLDFNECKDDEYRCSNGQCIPESFFRDDKYTPDCFDSSDERPKGSIAKMKCDRYVPSFECEDRTCRYSFLTNSCQWQRRDLLLKAMFSTRDSSVSEECWTAFKCVLKIPSMDISYCQTLCAFGACRDLIRKACPDMFFVTNTPLLLGDIYIAHTKADALNMASATLQTPYLCYDGSRYDAYFINDTKQRFQNKTCQLQSIMIFQFTMMITWELNYEVPLRHTYNQLKAYQPLLNFNSDVCKRPNMYQCLNSSKCIPISHLMNSRYDCPQFDDERLEPDLFKNMTKNLKGYFKCKKNNKYIHKSLVFDESCDCRIDSYGLCEDEDLELINIRETISFQTACDGFHELLPLTMNGRNYTDETECEQWKCSNIYTRCDGIWNCPNGQDEIGCSSQSTLNCSSNHHLCVSPETNQLMCLPIQKAGDDQVDCLGGTDEQMLCHQHYEEKQCNNFYCRNTTSQSCIMAARLCDTHLDCSFGDDEQFCVNKEKFRLFPFDCRPTLLANGTDVERFLCQHANGKTKPQVKFFFINGMKKTIEKSPNVLKPITPSTISKIRTTLKSQKRCHRGVDLHIWPTEEKNSTIKACLCPPSFYGDQCQYQNQRVSLTIKFRALSDSWSTVFSTIISLIDDDEERTIHSFEQLTYLSAKDCKLKFNIYLLYSTRPKNSTKTYAIHIDIYETFSLKYRASIFIPIKFSFLPVYRQASIIDIPRSHDGIQTCSNLQCRHGKCIKYSNQFDGKSFCQCYRGWHGRLCSMSHSSKCSSDSISLGITSNNRSVCVCPSHKFGPRCLLTNPICQSTNDSHCHNGGQCVPTDEYTIWNETFRCICPNGYSGDRCEIVDNKITLTFDKDVLKSQSIFIHFIRIMITSRPIRVTTLRTIRPTKDSIDIYWSQPFHLVFVEFNVKRYYLAILQTVYEPSTTIVKQINSKDLCQNISELFNASILQMHIVRRMKYYHLPCQTHSSNLTCFYDDTHLCLCYNFEHQRLANCFEFDHNMTSDCLGQSACENGGRCFQDTPDCPQRSMCVCPRCFYGTRCQFSTTGFGLSLDGILGYHILPHVSFIYQTAIVKFSFTITIIFMIVGYVNGFLSLITFKSKTTREAGCGWYLLGSSITTLAATTIFVVKFLILLLAQMALISNRSLLHIQCLTLDFFLRACLYMDQWLNACVALERAVTVIQAVRFRRQASKRMAKIVIVILLIIITGSLVYDPFYRRLIDDENEDEERIWCIVNYSSGFKKWNSFINAFHFIAPFAINLVSAVIIITKKSRQQQYVQNNRAYDEILKEQLQQNKRLFVAPVVLIILALPRLVISFLSKCMESINGAWFFLIGYFISFIPSMLTFVVFVLPSEFYKDECRKTLRAYRTKIQRRLKFVSEIQ